VPDAVSEVERLAGFGARSVHLPNFPTELGLPDYWDEVYDLLWSVLQEIRARSVMTSAWTTGATTSSASTRPLTGRSRSR
jgi:hypothetical protein